MSKNKVTSSIQVFQDSRNHGSSKKKNQLLRGLTKMRNLLIFFLAEFNVCFVFFQIICYLFFNLFFIDVARHKIHFWSYYTTYLSLSYI